MCKCENKEDIGSFQGGVFYYIKFWADFSSAWLLLGETTFFRLRKDIAPCETASWFSTIVPN